MVVDRTPCVVTGNDAPVRESEYWEIHVRHQNGYQSGGTPMSGRDDEGRWLSYFRAAYPNNPIVSYYLTHKVITTYPTHALDKEQGSA